VIRWRSFASFSDSALSVLQKLATRDVLIQIAANANRSRLATALELLGQCQDRWKAFAPILKIGDPERIPAAAVERFAPLTTFVAKAAVSAP
jgi:hypothetical protein